MYLFISFFIFEFTLFRVKHSLNLCIKYDMNIFCFCHSEMEPDFNDDLMARKFKREKKRKTNIRSQLIGSYIYRIHIYLHFN